MGLKSANVGSLVSSIKGGELLAFSFRTNVAAAPDRIRDGKSNAVTSVTRVGAGTYEVQLNGPYPRQLIAWALEISTVAAATTDYAVRMQVDSYSSTTGKFRVQTVLNDGTNAVEDPPDDAVIAFIGVFVPAGLNSMVQA